jgi:regulator of RNase E activity RraA
VKWDFGNDGPEFWNAFFVAGWPYRHCRVLDQPSDGRVLVVDGGGLRRVAVLGDRMAHLAMQNG